MGANWRALANEVVRRRVELGHETRKEFIEASGMKARTMGDIESARRDSYDPATLARLEKALEWPAGRVDEILARAEPVDLAVELMTAPGVLANLYAPKIELTELIHGSGLGPVDRYEIIREHRLAQQEFDRQQHVKIEADIRRRVEAQEADGGP